MCNENWNKFVNYLFEKKTQEVSKNIRIWLRFFLLSLNKIYEATAEKEAGSEMSVSHT